MHRDLVLIETQLHEPFHRLVSFLPHLCGPIVLFRVHLHQQEWHKVHAIRGQAFLDPAVRGHGVAQGRLLQVHHFRLVRIHEIGSAAHAVLYQADVHRILPGDACPPEFRHV